MTRGGLVRHLESCRKRKAAIDAADAGKGAQQLLLHLQVEAIGQPDYWLHLEMIGSCQLEELDQYLRAIWLECCGHMSQFSVGGWRGEEIPLYTRLDQALQTGDALTHTYDFGTSSECLIKPVGKRRGRPLSNHPILLMARNHPPQYTCKQCDGAASWLCLECLYDDDDFATFCDQHAKAHPHKAYDEPIPLVNSPRLGMCAYNGPADPPY
jgi:hypothetical protein